MRRALYALVGVVLVAAGLLAWLEAGFLFMLGVCAGLLASGFVLLYYCCRRKRWEAWRFVLFGAAVGAACALPFLGGRYIAEFLLMFFVLAGAIFGCAFWLAAIWRNTDLTCPKSYCLPCGSVYRVARNALGRQSK